MRRFLFMAIVLACAVPAWAGVLMIPNSSNDVIYTFDPFDGSLVDNNFINGDGFFGTPTTAIDSTRGSIFISDQIRDSIWEYSYDGDLLGTFADSTNGLDNVRGLTVYNDQLYAANYGNAGGLEETIQRFDLDGSNQVTWANAQGSPWWIHFRDNDVLISNSTDESVDRFGLDGTYLDRFADSDGSTSFDFPRQIHELSNGHILVASSFSPTGVFEFDSDGTPIRQIETEFGVRGIWTLGNGNYLFSGSGNVVSYNPDSEVFTTILDDGSFHHISYTPLPEPAAAFLLLGGALVMVRRR